jgi:NTE family protein
VRAPIGGVFGGGGMFGIGYAMGVIQGLGEHGVTFDRAPLLGTSAGSWAAAAVALDVDVQDMFALAVPTFPNPRPGVLATAARQLFGERTSPLVKVCACSLPRLRRTVFDGALHPIADLIAASSAVPGLLAPHTINGVRYVDGGVRSGTSVDFGPEADHLYVIAPLAGAMWGPFRRFVDRGMHNEIARWKERTGGTVTLFTPVAVAADIAQNPRHLFDKSRALEAYYCGIDQGRLGGQPA